MNDEAVIRELLLNPVAEENGVRRPKVLAVVGLSEKPDRPSHHVSEAMQKMGFKIVPVAPRGETILGEQVYHSLAEIPFPVDVVQVFRAPQYVPGVLADLKQMQHKPKLLWLQEGVINEEAAAEAEAYGLQVVMNRCTFKEANRLRG